MVLVDSVHILWPMENFWILLDGKIQCGKILRWYSFECIAVWKKFCLLENIEMLRWLRYALCCSSLENSRSNLLAINECSRNITHGMVIFMEIMNSDPYERSQSKLRPRCALCTQYCILKFSFQSFCFRTCNVYSSYVYLKLGYLHSVISCYYRQVQMT